MEQLLKSDDTEYFPPGVYTNILTEVKKACLEVDISIHEQLVPVIIKLLSLDPSHGLHLDGKLDRRSLGSFIDKCVGILFDKSSSLYLTLNMQMYFTQHEIDMERISKRNRHMLRENTAPLTKEIVCGEYNHYEQERFSNKIAVDVLVTTSMGNPINGKLIQETVSALKSVLSKNEIASFLAAKEIDRMASLEGIREVVCGILIFNRDNGFYVEDKIDAGINPNDISSTLSSDGVLTVTAPLKPQIQQNSERFVPITQTGPTKTDSNQPKVELS